MPETHVVESSNPSYVRQSLRSMQKRPVQNTTTPPPKDNVIRQLQTQIMQILVSHNLSQHLRYMNIGAEECKKLTEEEISAVNNLFHNKYKPAIAKSQTCREAFATQVATHYATAYNINSQNITTTSILAALKGDAVKV